MFTISESDLENYKSLITDSKLLVKTGFFPYYKGVLWTIFCTAILRRSWIVYFTSNYGYSERK